MSSNAMSLNVMVMESDRHVADAAIRELTDAGHVVLRCHDAGRGGVPVPRPRESARTVRCIRTRSTSRLTVRARPRSQPAATEDGVRCALDARVSRSSSPGRRCSILTSRTEPACIDRTDDVVAACEEVARGELPQHSRVATDALRASRTSNEMLGRADCRGDAPARRVARRRSAGSTRLAPRQRDAAIVRMMGKLREFDTSAPVHRRRRRRARQSSPGSIRNGIRHSNLSASAGSGADHAFATDRRAPARACCAGRSPRRRHRSRCRCPGCSGTRLGRRPPCR